MRLVQVFACGALIAASNAFAAPASNYAVTVQQGYVRPNAAGRIAIVPFACPKQIECDELEAGLIAALAVHTGATITASQHAQDVMVQARIDKLDYETGYILAESLAVDGFALVEIQEARVEVAEPKLIKMGLASFPNPERVKTVKLSLRLVAKDGASLLQASGEANVISQFRSMNEVALDTVEAVLQKAVADR